MGGLHTCIDRVGTEFLFMISWVLANVVADVAAIASEMVRATIRRLNKGSVQIVWADLTNISHANLPGFPQARKARAIVASDVIAFVWLRKRRF